MTLPPGGNPAITGGEEGMDQGPGESTGEHYIGFGIVYKQSGIYTVRLWVHSQAVSPGYSLWKG